MKCETKGAAVCPTALYMELARDCRKEAAHHDSAY